MTLYQSLLDHNYTTITDLLIITASLLCLSAYVSFLWTQRRMYKLASKLKGPVNLPIIGSAYLGLSSPLDFTKVLSKMIDCYGNGVRAWFGYKLVVGISDAKDAEIILTSPKCLEKSSLHMIGKTFFGNGLFTSAAPVWKMHKKIILPSFNQRNLDGFVTVFSEKSSILVGKLKTVCDTGEIDVLPILTNCSLDIISETTLGWNGNFQNDGAIHAENISVIMETIWHRIVYLHYHFDCIFNLTNQYKKYTIARDLFNTMIEKIITERVEKFKEKMKYCAYETKTSGKRDKLTQIFLDSLIENTLVTDKLSADDLRNEVVTMLIAGTDTTSLTNCFTLLLLALHQDVQEKVYEEVISVLGLDREILTTDLPNLMYLERVIKEALRLFPIGSVIARSLQEDINLTSVTLPAGTTVAIAIYKIHRNPAYWTDPERFDPDRFLPEEVSKRHPCAHIPFSAGPRNCLGFKFAMMALKTIVANIVRKYKLYTTYKSIEELELELHLVAKPVNGFKISIQSR